MIEKYLFYSGFLLIIFCLLTPSLFSNESAFIRATAHVVPAIGIENDLNPGSVSDSEQNLILRFPTTGSLLCRIETIDTIFEQSFGNDYVNGINKGRVVIPTGEIITNKGLTSADSCVVTIIYMEN